MTATTMELHAALIWGGEPIADVVLAKPGPVTIGPDASATFTVPDLGLPEVFPIVSVGERGYLLTMASAMAGTVSIGGVRKRVTDLVGEAPFAATPVGAGDWGVVDLDGAGGLQLFFQVGGKAERVAATRPWDLDTILPATAFSVVLHLLLIIGTFVLATGESPFVWPGARSLTGHYLATRISAPPPPPPVQAIAPIAPTPQKAGGDSEAKQPQPPKQSAKSGQRGSDLVKPDAVDDNAGGQVGLNDPKARALLNQMINTPNNLGKWTKNRGKGGTGNVDDTDDPGSTHGDPNGHGIAKQGDLDTSTGQHPGHGHGHGHGDGDGDGTSVKEVLVAPPPDKVIIEDGCTDANEIAKRMMSHKTMFGVCFQKALDRSGALDGTINTSFKIGSDGRATEAKYKSSTIKNGEVQACIDRALKSIRFPLECSGAIIRYPLVFNGGGR